MGERYSLLYRYSKDNGTTWTDISEAVDSRETKITQSLCTNNFTSAKDSVTFTLPATNLVVKNQLVADLLGNDDLLFEIYIPSPSQVLWDAKDVEWDGNKVLWKGRNIGFTGYIDRSSVNLKSYPLPTALTLTAYDVSFLMLDEKVDQHVLLENKTVTEIVHTLLGMAGYSYDSSAIASGEEVTLEAFVIDKDKAKTYRQYIDTLLFEVGGYVLDFMPNGVARIFRLPWDDAVQAVRSIDNPMGDNGISIKSAWMQNDGVRLTWSTLSWSGADQVLWRDSIQRQVDSSGLLTGETIHNGRYWPDGGEITPAYMNYSADLLDTPYLTRESRKKNEDLAIIMAKNVYAYIQATRNGSPYTFPVPAGYPVPADFQADPYNFTSNPMIWPLKAWWLLYNNSGSDVNLQFFTVKGMALYRSKLNTLETAGSSKPKEYESTYIYDASQAQRFLDFYWHFLQTSRFSMTWSEPYIDEDLGDVVEMTQKGMPYTQDAVIVAKTMQFINENIPVISYSAVGVAVPVLEAGVGQSDILQGAVTPERGASTVYAQTATTPSHTLSQWQTFGTDGYQQTWSVTNDAEFRAGDIAVIRGVISDLDNTPITLYITVTSVGSGSINGVGRSIEYAVAEMWDFDLSQTMYITNKRLVSDANQIKATAHAEGHAGITISWTALDDDGTTIATGTGESFTFYIAYNNSYKSPITVRMEATGLQPVEKSIIGDDQTEYDHDFGAWEPTDDGTNIFVLPDHFTDGGIDYDIIQGDFFVAKKTFAVYSEGSAVTPSGTEDPADLGWYERKGNGTNAKPYYWLLTADTSVVAGKTYGTVSGQAYTEGSPYQYASNSWYNPITATTQNARKMLSCLANVLSDPNIQPSTSALYAWFENLVAKNAVLENLVAMFLQVGPGTGLAGSGFRFRALNDDGNGSPVFDVYYGNKKVFQIDVTSGDILFGGGMVYHASTDTIEANNAVFNGIKINNSNGGEANFGSAIFKQENMTSNVYTLASSRYNDQGKYFFDAVSSVYNSTPGSGNYSPYFPCTVNSSVSGASNARYVRSYYYYNPNYFDQYSEYAVFFYDENYHQISSLNCIRYTANHSDVRPFSVGDSVDFLTGGNLMILFNIPLVTGTPTLSSGRVYRDSNNFLKIVP